MKQFDKKRENDYFRELTYLRKQGMMDDYALEFQNITVMIHKIFEERLTFLFVEGLI